MHFGFETFQPDQVVRHDRVDGRSSHRGDGLRNPKPETSHSPFAVERDSLIAEVFERLPCGVIILDAQRNIIATNQIGEALLAKPSSGLFTRNGRLEPANPQQAALLRKLVASACSSDKGSANQTMLLSGTGEQPAFSLAIASLNASSNRDDDEGGRAVIFIKALSLDLPSAFSGRLQALFGLSAKEASLATMLAEGYALKEAASALGVRFATARSYLESIFQKTAVNRQGQLVALLRTVQPLE